MAVAARHDADDKRIERLSRLTESAHQQQLSLPERKLPSLQPSFCQLPGQLQTRCPRRFRGRGPARFQAWSGNGGALVPHACSHHQQRRQRLREHAPARTRAHGQQARTICANDTYMYRSAMFLRDGSAQLPPRIEYDALGSSVEVAAGGTASPFPRRCLRPGLAAHASPSYLPRRPLLSCRGAIDARS